MICYQSWPLELAESGATVGRWGICRLEHAEDGGAFLTGEEHRRAAGFGCRRRRLEWLGARAGLRRMLHEAGICRQPTACKITQDHRGKPLLDLGGCRETRRVEGSLTHKDGLAGFAAVWEGELTVGVDVEAVGSKPWRCRRAFATSSDVLLDSKTNYSYFSVLWCCKEAASKAVGTGLLIDFRELTIFESVPGMFTVGRQNMDLMAGRYFLFDGMVAAVVMMPRGGGAGLED